MLTRKHQSFDWIKKWNLTLRLAYNLVFKPRTERLRFVEGGLFRPENKNCDRAGSLVK